jgi:hypothetical protein
LMARLKAVSSVGRSLVSKAMMVDELYNHWELMTTVRARVFAALVLA